MFNRFLFAAATQTEAFFPEIARDIVTGLIAILGVVVGDHFLPLLHEKRRRAQVIRTIRQDMLQNITYLTACRDQGLTSPRLRSQNFERALADPALTSDLDLYMTINTVLEATELVDEYLDFGKVISRRNPVLKDAFYPLVGRMVALAIDTSICGVKMLDRLYKSRDAVPLETWQETGMASFLKKLQEMGEEIDPMVEEFRNQIHKTVGNA